MKFKDPIAPRYGQVADKKIYTKKFAWFPTTTHDGYGIWLHSYYTVTIGGANTTFTSKLLNIN